jgi:hypothetical protein
VTISMKVGDLMMACDIVRCATGQRRRCFETRKKDTQTS